MNGRLEHAMRETNVSPMLDDLFAKLRATGRQTSPDPNAPDLHGTV